MEQKAINLLIKIFLVMLPIFLFKDYVPSFAQGMFFLIGIFTLYGLSIGTEPIRRFKNPYLKLIYLWLLLCVFFRIQPQPHLEWFNFWLSSGGFLYVLAGMMLYTLVYSYAENIKKFIIPITIVSVLNFILVIAQVLGHDFLWKNASGYCGFMSTENLCGEYSAMSMPLLYYLNPYLAIIPLITLLITKTKAAIFASLIGFIFLITYKQINKIFIVIAIVIIGLFGLIVRPNMKTYIEVKGIRQIEILNYIFKKPYLGYGYQSFNEVTNRPDTEIGTNLYNVGRGGTYNDYLHNIMEFGIPFILFIGLFFINLWHKFKGQIKPDRITYFLISSIIIILTNMLLQNMIRYAAIGGSVVVILALLNIKLDEVRE